MRRLIALGVLGVVIVLLVVAQLVLPGIAAQRLRTQLSRSGQVLSVQVSAFPAIKLLWHHADKVVIRMGNYRSASAAHLSATLEQTGNVGTLDASAQEFEDGLLRVHDARLLKRGNQLIATARIAEADLRSAIPILRSVTPVASADGQLVLRGTSTLLPFSIDFTVRASNGDLVAAPDVPLGGFATITLFHNRRIAVQSINAAPAAGGFTVQAVGALR
jgi:hypothetical protein